MNDEHTKPTDPQASLEQAIQLAKRGQKSRAGDMLRDVVAREPNNQAAWLWLSAIAATRPEAEAALTQAKKINPEHHAMNRAEQWLVHRFSAQSETRRNPMTEATPADSKSTVSRGAVPPTTAEKPTAAEPVDDSLRGEEAPRPLKTLNAFAFGLAIVVVVSGLLVLFFGLVFEVNGSAALASNQAVETQLKQQEIEQIQRQLDQALVRQDWPTSISLLESLRNRQPDSAEISGQLVQVHVQQGFSLRNRGFIEEALTSFEQALKLDANQPRLQREVQLAQSYSAGAEFYQQGQWSAAIAELEKTWRQDKNYINVQDLLYSAYYNHGLAQQAAGDFIAAKGAFEAAAALRPDLSEPRRLLAKLEFDMAPRTPANLPSNTNIEDRLILVGIAEQRMVVYDGEEVVFEFVISTGEPGRDTAVGEFEILNKIDNAYASTWNLDMPFWMGIYWAGPLQNGIHSLPIVKHTGYKLWDGYLGQRVSYGCVILSDADAATLYDWTEVGTKVKIVPNLANYSPNDE